MAIILLTCELIAKEWVVSFFSGNISKYIPNKLRTYICVSELAAQAEERTEFF